MQTLFRVRKYESSVITEIIAGITSFLTISYILSINPMILQKAGMPFAGVFVATALTAGLCTLFLALFANTPYTVAPAMSCNAYFANVISLALGFAWQESLFIGFVAGLIHLTVMVGRFRRPFTNHCLPKHIKNAGTIGIGSLIAVGGVNYAGLVSSEVARTDNVAFDISRLTDTLPPIIGRFPYASLVAVAGLMIITFLLALERKTGDRYGAVPMGILGATFIGIPLGVTNLIALHTFDLGMLSEFREVAFALFGNPGLLSLLATPERMLTALLVSMSVGIFRLTDSIVTVIGAGNIRNNRIFSREEMEEFSRGPGPAGRLDHTLTADSVASLVGPLLGTGPCGVFVESSLPIASGGRTGLTAMVSGTLFLASIPLVNLFHVLPAEAVGAALILSGVFPLMLMFEIDWDDFQQAIPSGLCVLLIVATHNFVGGVAVGAVSHLVIQTTLGKWRSLHPLLLLTTLLLSTTSVLLHMVRQ